MENNLRYSFFFIHGSLLNMKAFFESDRAVYIFGPIYPLLTIIISFNGLCDGQWIIFNLTMLIIGFIFLSFTIFVAKDHFNSKDYFKQFKSFRSNQILPQSDNKSKTFNNIPHKDVSVLIADNKDLINKYFSRIRRIGLVNDDTSQSDFESLIANCFMESETDFIFNLEINANQANGFVREFMVPFLKIIDENSSVSLKDIVSLLNYKKNKGYTKMKESTTKNKKRVVITREQKELYNDLKK